MDSNAKTSLASLIVGLLCIASVGRAQQSPRDSPSAAKAAKSAVADSLTRVSSAEMGRLLLKRVPPQYPKKARKKRIQGTVMLKAIISQQGDVVGLSVMSGDPLLSDAAINAAKQWKYKPYMVEGEAVEVETAIQMNFILSGD